MIMRTSKAKGNGNARGNSDQALEELPSKQILDILHAWQNEFQAVDFSALLKAFRAFRKGDSTVCLSENQTGIADETARVFNESIETCVLIQNLPPWRILSGRPMQLNYSETESLNYMFDNRRGE